MIDINASRIHSCQRYLHLDVPERPSESSILPLILAWCFKLLPCKHLKTFQCFPNFYECIQFAPVTAGLIQAVALNILQQ